MPSSAPPPSLHSFPTRRSSDLSSIPTSGYATRCAWSSTSSSGAAAPTAWCVTCSRTTSTCRIGPVTARPRVRSPGARPPASPSSADRKSTLNSSHANISYAVFCSPTLSPLFPYTTLFRSILDPDERVRATLRLVFDIFERRRSAHGVVRYLFAHDIDLPDRARHGPTKGEITWRPPTRVAVLGRSEEHSELQSRQYLVCRLLLPHPLSTLSLHDALPIYPRSRRAGTRHAAPGLRHLRAAPQRPRRGALPVRARHRPAGSGPSRPDQG